MGKINVKETKKYNQFFLKFPSLKKEVYEKDKSGFNKDWFEHYKAFTLEQVQKCCIDKNQLKKANLKK